MKKILSTVAALAVTFSAQGETTSAINPFAGWYIGLGAAVSNSSDKVESLYGQGYDDIYGFIPANAAVSPQNVVIEPEANGAVINAHTAAQPDQDVPVYAYLLNAAAATAGQAQVALPNLVKNNFYYLSSQADPAAIAANSIWVQDGVLQAAANAQNAADATQYRYVDIEGHYLNNPSMILLLFQDNPDLNTWVEKEADPQMVVKLWGIINPPSKDEGD